MNQLDQYKYTPQNGILKRNESNRTQIKLDGYSLAELAEILTQEKRLGRFFVEKGKDGPTYSFQLNVSSVNTLRDSLRLYGITLKSCKRAVSLYELKWNLCLALEDLKNPTLLDSMNCKFLVQCSNDSQFRNTGKRKLSVVNHQTTFRSARLAIKRY